MSQPSIEQVKELAEAKWAVGEARGRAEGEARGRAEGGLEARRNTLLRLVERAQIRLADSDLARIRSCTDTQTLDRWVDNVFGARTAAEVLT